jgi:hypothetical protein
MPWLSLRGILYERWNLQHKKCALCESEIDARDLEVELMSDDGTVVCPECFEDSPTGSTTGMPSTEG